MNGNNYFRIYIYYKCNVYLLLVVLDSSAKLFNK